MAKRFYERKSVDDDSGNGQLELFIISNVRRLNREELLKFRCFEFWIYKAWNIVQRPETSSRLYTRYIEGNLLHVPTLRRFRVLRPRLLEDNYLLQGLYSIYYIVGYIFFLLV